MRGRATATKFVAPYTILLMSYLGKILSTFNEKPIIW